MQEDIISHYAQIQEEERLLTGSGALEYARSQELIDRYLPPLPAVILDVGGGPGAYSCWLAGKGYEAGIPQIKPTFLDIAPSGIPSNIIPHSKGVKCGLIRSNSPFSYSNHRPAKPKIPKPLVYAQVSPLGTSFATP